jgi:hypothetical protein
MPSEIPSVSIPASAFSHHGARWTGRRVLGTLLGVWVVAAALLAAVVLAIVWDLRP